MALCLSCNHSNVPAGLCSSCGAWTVDDSDVVSITLPADVLRMFVGMAERFVATVSPLERAAVAAAFYAAVDRVEEQIDVGPLTISGAQAAAIARAWETA